MGIGTVEAETNVGGSWAIAQVRVESCDRETCGPGPRGDREADFAEGDFQKSALQKQILQNSIWEAAGHQ